MADSEERPAAAGTADRGLRSDRGGHDQDTTRFRRGQDAPDIERIALALCGVRGQAGVWNVRCPLPTHGQGKGDRNPSLSIAEADGRLLVHCHAGCDPLAVLSEVRHRGLIGPERGISRRNATRQNPERPSPPPARTSTGINGLAIWRASHPLVGTLGEAYLAARGLEGVAPETLRFHPALRHPAGGVWPAMVALVSGGADNVPMAIHRTFLARDGKAKAPVQPNKLMLGQCKGGAVRLADCAESLMVGEGIETCLSAQLATGRPAWAALSTSGLRSLYLPATVRDVTILADGDVPGEAAARAASLRWKREGRRVRIARAPAGMDFNDLLAGRRAVPEERV